MAKKLKKPNYVSMHSKYLNPNVLGGFTDSFVTRWPKSLFSGDFLGWEYHEEPNEVYAGNEERKWRVQREKGYSRWRKMDPIAKGGGK